jgi:hypothetical protein
MAAVLVKGVLQGRKRGLSIHPDLAMKNMMHVHRRQAGKEGHARLPA